MSWKANWHFDFAQSRGCYVFFLHKEKSLESHRCRMRKNHQPLIKTQLALFYCSICSVTSDRPSSPRCWSKEITLFPVFFFCFFARTLVLPSAAVLMHSLCTSTIQLAGSEALSRGGAAAVSCDKPSPCQPVRTSTWTSLPAWLPPEVIVIWQILTSARKQKPGHCVRRHALLSLMELFGRVFCVCGLIFRSWIMRKTWRASWCGEMWLLGEIWIQRVHLSLRRMNCLNHRRCYVFFLLVVLISWRGKRSGTDLAILFIQVKYHDLS